MKLQTSLLIVVAVLHTTNARTKPLPANHKPKDSVTKKQAATYDEPKTAESRIGRSSPYTATLLQPQSYKVQGLPQGYASYPLVLNPQYSAAAATSLALASLGEAAVSKQPKKFALAYAYRPTTHDATKASGSDASLSLANAQYSSDYSAALNTKDEASPSAAIYKQAPPTSPSAGTPLVSAVTSYRQDEAASTHQDEYAAKYQFGYQVRDPKHGGYFGHAEAREGRVTRGHYHVLLPDGRLQSVRYVADESGFHARVSYDGVGKHASA